MRSHTSTAVSGSPARTTLSRRIHAEFVGTAALVTAVVGSGTMAARLSPTDVGVELLANCLATVAALAVLIVVLRPLSGAHFNPVVSVADWRIGRTSGAGISTDN